MTHYLVKKKHVQITGNSKHLFRLRCILKGIFYSFISLVPDEIKTSALTGDTGYDTYLRDAHRQVHFAVLLILPQLN